MARIALTRTDETDFIPEAFRAHPDGERPTFRIVPLTGAQRHAVNVLRAGALTGRIGDEKAEVDLTKHVEARLQAARLGLRGWRNVEAEDGQPVAWPGDGHRGVDLLPTEVATAIGDGVIERSSLSETQRGN